jgi:predicted Rdx family selenoprotein
VELIGGGKGNFIVVVDGDTVWHKKKMGNKFPDEANLVRNLANR